MFFQRLDVRVTQHFGVKRLLAAEMVIHRSDVRARAAANFAHGRVTVTGPGKHLARRLQKLAARLGMAGVAGSGWQLRFHFKRIIQTNV